jgi:thioredoxin 1
MSSLFAKILLSLCLVALPVEALAAPSMAEAVAEYSHGQYRSALLQFNQLKKLTPNNVQVRYYAALCEQNLNLKTEARSDYEWVLSHGGEPLRSYAQRGLATIAKLGGGSGSSQTAMLSAEPEAAPTAGKAAPKAKVKKILEFYTTWCHVCTEFAPIFEEGKKHFRDVQFVSVNAEEEVDLKQQYGVRAFPTLVYLDASGRVLLNQKGAPSTLVDFESTILEYGGEKR